MVVKPLEFVVRGPKGLVQPAVKCRGREYLRIIYGPDYTADEHLGRLRSRGLPGKRSLALREFALGIEALACPLHGSTSGTSRCFSAHLDKNAFHCFKCGRCGNALDLWAAATSQTPYDAATDLCTRLGIPLPILVSNHRNREEKPVAPSPTASTMPTTT